MPEKQVRPPTFLGPVRDIAVRKSEWANQPGTILTFVTGQENAQSEFEVVIDPERRLLFSDMLRSPSSRQTDGQGIDLQCSGKLDMISNDLDPASSFIRLKINGLIAGVREVRLEIRRQDLVDQLQEQMTTDELIAVLKRKLAGSSWYKRASKSLQFVRKGK
jgi:hypothetical protein